jgi:hypothetical protein
MPFWFFSFFDSRRIFGVSMPLQARKNVFAGHARRCLVRVVEVKRLNVVLVVGLDAIDYRVGHDHSALCLDAQQRAVRIAIRQPTIPVPAMTTSAPVLLTIRIHLYCPQLERCFVVPAWPTPSFSGVMDRRPCTFESQYCSLNSSSRAATLKSRRRSSLSLSISSCRSATVMFGKEPSVFME